MFIVLAFYALSAIAYHEVSVERTLEFKKKFAEYWLGSSVNAPEREVFDRSSKFKITVLVPPG